MPIYGATKAIATILSIERSLETVAHARDVSHGDEAIEQAWRILDHRRQELIQTLGPDQDCLLEKARNEEREWKIRREAMAGPKISLS